MAGSSISFIGADLSRFERGRTMMPEAIIVVLLIGIAAGFLAENYF
jgi:hypothetical protein